MDDDDPESSKDSNKGTPKSKSKRPLSEGSKVSTDFGEVLDLKVDIL